MSFSNKIIVSKKSSGEEEEEEEENKITQNAKTESSPLYMQVLFTILTCG